MNTFENMKRSYAGTNGQGTGSELLCGSLSISVYDALSWRAAQQLASWDLDCITI